MSIAKMMLKEYFRPKDLVDVGTMTWLGLTIVALAVMYISSFPSLQWFAGLLFAINIGGVTALTAYYEYTEKGRKQWH